MMILHLCLSDTMYPTVHKVLAATSQNIAFHIRCYVYMHSPHVYKVFCSILSLMWNNVEKLSDVKMWCYFLVIQGAHLSQSAITCMQRPSWHSNIFWWLSETAFPVVTTFTNLIAASHNLWAWISIDQHTVLLKMGWFVCSSEFEYSENRVQSLNFLSTESKLSEYRVLSGHFSNACLNDRVLHFTFL